MSDQAMTPAERDRKIAELLSQSQSSGKVAFDEQGNPMDPAVAEAMLFSQAQVAEPTAPPSFSDYWLKKLGPLAKQLVQPSEVLSRGWYEESKSNEQKRKQTETPRPAPAAEWLKSEAGKRFREKTATSTKFIPAPPPSVPSAAASGGIIGARSQGGEPKRIVAVKDPETGKITWTNNPSSGGAPLEQAVAQTELLGKQNAGNIAGPFAIHEGLGTLSGGGTLANVVGMTPEAYQETLNASSPLVQEMLMEQRVRAQMDKAQTQEGTLQDLQIQVARKKMDPRFSAEMELALTDELQKRALADPGVKASVEATMLDFQSKNPQAPPDQVLAVRSMALSRLVQKYIMEHNPAIQERLAGTGMLGVGNP